MGDFNYDASIYVVAAIVGNWYAESGLNPNVFEGHVSYTYSELLSESVSGGYGLGQWTTNSKVNRRIPLLEWLATNDYNYYDGEGQVLYLVDENFWVKHYGSYSSLDAFLCSDSTDLETLTVCYLKNWEIPSDSGSSVQAKRYSYAKTAFYYIQDYYDPDTTYYWEYSEDTSGSLTTAQQYNNTLAAFQLLGNGVTTGSIKTHNFKFSKNYTYFLKPYWKQSPMYWFTRSKKR